IAVVDVQECERQPQSFQILGGQRAVFIRRGDGLDLRVREHGISGDLDRIDKYAYLAEFLLNVTLRWCRYRWESETRRRGRRLEFFLQRRTWFTGSECGIENWGKYLCEKRRRLCDTRHDES